MRILLDECLPRELADELTGHVVRTVGRMGWAGKKNGELLRLAGPAFDVLITADRSLPKQQNIRSQNIRVVTLIAHNKQDGITSTAASPASPGSPQDKTGPSDSRECLTRITAHVFQANRSHTAQGQVRYAKTNACRGS